MTSPIPGLLAWPALALVTVVLLGRWWLLSDSEGDRLIDRALTAALVGLLLRERLVEQMLVDILPFPDSDVVNVARQLSFGGILLCVAAIYGLAQLWAGADPTMTRQRQRRYDLVALASTTVILIAGTPARRADELIDQTLGWPAVVAWVAFYLPIGAIAFLVGRISIRELRGADETTTWRERILCLGVLGIAALIGLDALATPVITALEVHAGQPSSDPEMITKAWTFFIATVWATSVVAVPLMATVLTRSGWDRTGRACRQLHPLWQDLTAAVPEIVLPLPAGRVEPATRLHRLIVEIRDSLMFLKRYGVDDTVAQDPATYARAIAAAIAAKSAGQPPAADTAASRAVQPGSRDLAAELNQLVALAKAWSRTPRDTTAPTLTYSRR
ncbi:MAB_1171c family putative transporter [Nocardia camponoti]|uniref:DUF6545 domain-containing protein n=1 Tax=Nocardia camponoti TaxID=1616106 RepID=A0A917QU06_9NOCA|nr:MAB_1171c family putative transporter [Nocardia camponoti]GGK68649.1 hypothetical protein GCM10011591_45950 [Nocardia camponoti]